MAVKAPSDDSIIKFMIAMTGDAEILEDAATLDLFFSMLLKMLLARAQGTPDGPLIVEDAKKPEGGAKPLTVPALPKAGP